MAKKAAEMTPEELTAQRAKWAAAKRAQTAKKKAAREAAARNAAETVAGDAHELPPGVRISSKPAARSIATEATEDEPGFLESDLHDEYHPEKELPAEGTAARAELEKEYDTKGPGAKPAAPVAANEPTKPAPKPAAKKEPLANGRGMAARARALILEGKSNAEVRAVLVAEFKLPEEHAYYPSWYRAQLVMKGLITKEWAREHSGSGRKK